MVVQAARKLWRYSVVESELDVKVGWEKVAVHDAGAGEKVVLVRMEVTRPKTPPLG